MSQVCTLDANGNYECGTGGWSGPKPGDPNTTNMLITATPAYGGIDVNWTYPDIHPEAVAFTTIYRSLLPATETATILRAAVQGSFYFDRSEVDTPVQYYYWIKVTSIYGTESEMIGPAWATAMPQIGQMIEILTGQIDAGVLAQSLKQEIDRIQLNSLNIDQELIDRAANDDALGVRINFVGAHSEETRALLMEEVLARTSANEAFVQTINTLYADVNGNIAALQVKQTAMASDIAALAQQVTNLEAQVGEDLAQVLVTMETKINTVDGKVTDIGARWTAQVNVNGLVGGFGVYNNGSFIEAGFDVDRFWVGRTGADNRKPFIIENSVVYIDDAAINKLTFDKLRSSDGSFIVQNGKIQAQYLEVNQLTVNEAMSTNYVQGVSGWYLAPGGWFELNSSVPGQGRSLIQGGNFYTYYASGRLATALGVGI